MSLSRPGGNLTGIFLDQADLSGKWLELLSDAIPKIARVAVLWDTANPSPQLKAIEHAAARMGIQLQLVEREPPIRCQAGSRPPSRPARPV
jgi:putative ABC transport system substrate-binding protein